MIKMLKGHVFKEQVFESQIFALFMDTFLAGHNGVCKNYKNGMKVTTEGNTVNINSGVVCIQGRFLEEDTLTQIATGTDNAFCKLVVEIDLSKENTSSSFVQGSYKILKSTSSYPNLVQTDIIANNDGIYQYELARFKTSANGISDFVDARTYLDFDSIYEKISQEFKEVLNELKKELSQVEDGSAYVLKNDYIVFSKEFTAQGNSDESVSFEFSESMELDDYICIGYEVIDTKGNSATAGGSEDLTMEQTLYLYRYGVTYTYTNKTSSPVTRKVKILLKKI